MPFPARLVDGLPRSSTESEEELCGTTAITVKGADLKAASAGKGIKIGERILKKKHKKRSRAIDVGLAAAVTAASIAAGPAASPPGKDPRAGCEDLPATVEIIPTMEADSLCESRSENAAMRIGMTIVLAAIGRWMSMDLALAWCAVAYLLLVAPWLESMPFWRKRSMPVVRRCTDFCEQDHDATRLDEDSGDDERWQINVLEDGRLRALSKDGQAPGVRQLAQGILVDSGAGVSIADGTEVFPEYPVEESPGSKAGQTYAGAKKGDVIPNRGQRNVRLRLGGAAGERAALKMQDAPVRRPILSVSDSNDAGNLLVFDKEESAILPKGSPEIKQIRGLVAKAKRKISMKRNRGIFTLDA